MGAAVSLLFNIPLYFIFSVSDDTMGAVYKFFIVCGILSVFIYCCVSFYKTAHDKDTEEYSYLPSDDEYEYSKKEKDKQI